MDAWISRGETWLNDILVWLEDSRVWKRHVDQILPNIPTEPVTGSKEANEPTNTQTRTLKWNLATTTHRWVPNIDGKIEGIQQHRKPVRKRFQKR